MKKALKYTAWGLAAIAVVALIAWIWANQVATGRYEQKWTVHKAEFPIPFPLSGADIEALRAERILAGAPDADPLAGVDLRPWRWSARSGAASTSSRAVLLATPATAPTSVARLSSTWRSSVTGWRPISLPVKAA